jgi:hypothetical protein
MKWAGHIVHMGERRGAYRVLMGNLRERDHFEDTVIDWEDNIKMDLQEVGWTGHGLECFGIG